METLFNKDNTIITGKHAAIMQRLCTDKGGDQFVSFQIKNVKGGDEEISIFKDRINCFLVAAMLGLISKRIALPDTSSDARTTIFANMFGRDRFGEDVLRIYKYIILSEESGDATADDIIKKAFTIDSQADVQEAEKKILGYVLGGLEILDEYFNPQTCTTYEQVCYQIAKLLGTISDSPIPEF